MYHSAARVAATFAVAIRPGDTPVPIPNTMVKTRSADGTMLETVWESRRLPQTHFLQGDSGLQATVGAGDPVRGQKHHENCISKMKKDI